MAVRNQAFVFGAIADDYTGGADLAGMLFEQGVATAQLFGVPREELIAEVGERCQAAVVCLKSRSIAAAEACRLSSLALDRLTTLAPKQVQFKYCSTFDSTAEGNIGPVAETLLARLSQPFTIAVPALPVNGRTQYQGHLFVGGRLLSETHMRNHPLNPMTDSDLVRHLQRQCSAKTGLIALDTVRQGPDAIRKAADGLSAGGIAIALVDAVCDSDLANIAEAAANLPLITGGSGITSRLPDVWRKRGWLREAAGPLSTPGNAAPDGALVLSGSCSAATLQQLEELERSGWSAVERLDPRALLHSPEDELARLLAASRASLELTGRAAVRSSSSAEARQGKQSAELSGRIEAVFGRLAAALVGEGLVGRVVVAGGETSGAVVDALGLEAVEIAALLDPGVPALREVGGRGLRLALKSGNFGSVDFFVKAIRALEAL